MLAFKCILLKFFNKHTGSAVKIYFGSSETKGKICYLKVHAISIKELGTNKIGF